MKKKLIVMFCGLLFVLNIRLESWNPVIFAETTQADFQGIYQYNNEQSVLNGIEIADHHLEISLNMKNEVYEDDPFIELYTQLMNLDYETKNYLTGKLDPSKPQPQAINKEDLPTFKIHFADIKKWKSPSISVFITEPNYKILDETLYISYKNKPLFKLIINDQGDLLHHEAILLKTTD